MLAETAGGVLWLGTSQGLVKAEPNAGGGFDFSLFKNEPGNPNSLRNNAVAALLADLTDPTILWVGTKGGGLTRLDTRTGQMHHLTTRNGLPNDVIYNILSTPDQPSPANLRLWLSSNKGIIRYTPATGEIRNFTEADGAQGDEFNTWAAAKTTRGTLLFGGLNGLNEIDPAAFSENPHLPPVFLTGLKINNHPVSAGDTTGLLPQSLEFLSNLELPFSKNSLTLSFAALEYTAPGKNRFRYFLEGAEGEWAHETTDNSATYLNLPPGSYTFKVMAANGDGVWNPQPAELHIRILPPWWRSWWAYLFYIGIAAAGAWWFYRFQLRRKLEQAENHRLKELNTFKSRLYANITHEFRTPLTVILGMTERSKLEIEKLEIPDGEAISQFLISNSELIGRNGENLLRLVNQMLDLSKLEAGAMALHPQRSDAVGFVKYLLEAFQSLAAAKNVRLRFQSEIEECEMDFDAEKLQQVVSNLLSNAVKFTPPGGKVNLKLEIGKLEIAGRSNFPISQFLISVSDNGIGIPPDKLPHIFNRFYQVDDTHTRPGEGTGIGLALVKELVKLMGGEISVKSEVGVGTEFLVRLPVAQSPPTPPIGGEPRRQQPTPVFQEIISEFPFIGSPIRRVVGENGGQPLLLIIEDNADIAHYIGSCFDGEYRIAFARNGQEGIEQALELIPDAIISDVMMPEKDGFEVVQTLKNDERTSHVPIILLTAKADAASKLKGLERGADEYLAKPFGKQELRVRIRNLLEQRRRMQERFSSIDLFSKNVISDSAEDKTFQIEDAFLLKIKAEVERHLQDADFGVPQLSRAMGMSQSQLYRKIKALTDQSSAAFIRLVRLQKGRELLKTTRLTVSEIAYETGFSSPGYFSDAYLEEFGERPREARG